MMTWSLARVINKDSFFQDQILNCSGRSADITSTQVSITVLLPACLVKVSIPRFLPSPLLHTDFSSRATVASGLTPCVCKENSFMEKRLFCSRWDKHIPFLAMCGFWDRRKRLSIIKKTERGRTELYEVLGEVGEWPGIEGERGFPNSDTASEILLED